MPELGISSACYYPLTTEESIVKICENGIKTIEIFFNTTSELSDKYIDDLIKIKNNYGVSFPSVHPFFSFAETFFFFSTYERRFHDSLELYRRFFEIMAQLKSEIFIIHGLKEPGIIEDNLYFDRFAKLIEIGKEYNIKVCQENVYLHKSQSADYLSRMKNYIGDDFNIVLDIKQAFKSKEDPFLFIDLLSDRIKHIHLSDHNSNCPCIPPLEGTFDFERFFSRMNHINYKGNFIIELYDHSYEHDSQIYNSYNKTKKLLVDYFN